MAALAELESDDAAEHVAAEALLQAEQLRQLQENLAAARQRQVGSPLTAAGRAGVRVQQTMRFTVGCPCVRTDAARGTQRDAAAPRQW